MTFHKYASKMVSLNPNRNKTSRLISGLIINLGKRPARRAGKHCLTYPLSRYVALR